MIRSGDQRRSRRVHRPEVNVEAVRDDTQPDFDLAHGEGLFSDTESGKIQNVDELEGGMSMIEVSVFF